MSENDRQPRDEPAGKRRWRAWAAFTGTTRWRATALLWNASRPLFFGVVCFVLAEGVLPNLAFIAIGRATGSIPAAVRDGMASPSGHRLIVTLVFAGIFYALSLLRGPAEDLLSTECRVRVSSLTQTMLVEAVCQPVGIEHLEDPAVLDRLSAASGELVSNQPADAAMTFAGVIGDQLAGVLACVVLATWQWWVGLVMLAGWLAIRRPLFNLWSARATLTRGAAGPLRHSWYYLGLAWRPAAAKEMRTFGLGEWTLGQARTLWLEGMNPPWASLRRLERRAYLLGAAVISMYALSAGELAWAGYQREIRLQTISIMLMMLATSSQVAAVGSAGISLEQMLAAIPDLDSLIADLAAHRDLAVGTRAVTPGAPHDAIRFESVRYAYPGGDRDVLDGLDLTLPARSSLAVVGVNGAGKSTLVTLLARLRDPTSGRITVDGVDISEFDAAAWQRHVAVVYQDFTRYPLSARENVSLATLDRDPSELGPAPALLNQIAEQSGMARIVEHLPGGWETILSKQFEGGTDLSGGQWQRVALARALYAVANGAGVLILDEPTAQLDIRAEAAFYGRFLELTSGVATIVISHRFATVRRADRIAVLDGGRISELGTHDELIDANGTYASMFLAQAAAFADITGTPGRDGDG